ncbi:NPC intracellular cholesterol transporter 2 homolog a [Linepithema humile]|uniref:NPC intracellular cholesterol transporter 2 homolog a n=1 Tax=Linepithema humile TaxID=83485 RepID=UPI0006233648|nr:PREDICTED: protein NPC2 homolog [Linepithema humile]
MSRVFYIAFALVCALCCSAPCLGVSFENCGSTLGKFTAVSVSGCQATDEKCVLVRGTNASISITFVPNEDVSHVTARVYGIMMTVPIPFPLDKPDVCKDPDDGVNCPLQGNQEYHYTTALFVQKKFPSVSVDIKWEFVDSTGKKIVCILFPAKVK